MYSTIEYTKLGNNEVQVLRYCTSLLFLVLCNVMNYFLEKVLLIEIICFLKYF